MHILLVEDNEGDIFLATETLGDLNIVTDISVVRDGKQAIDFLNKSGEYSNKESPDLILLDINLPKKNGHEVLQYIKSTRNLRLIPVVMLSTSSFEKDINQSFENFADGYTTKPLETDEFMQAISKLNMVVLKAIDISE